MVAYKCHALKNIFFPSFKWKHLNPARVTQVAGSCSAMLEPRGRRPFQSSHMLMQPWRTRRLAVRWLSEKVLSRVPVSHENVEALKMFLNKTTKKNFQSNGSVNIIILVNFYCMLGICQVLYSFFLILLQPYGVSLLICGWQKGPQRARQPGGRRA